VERRTLMAEREKGQKKFEKKVGGGDRKTDCTFGQTSNAFMGKHLKEKSVEPKKNLQGGRKVG